MVKILNTKQNDFQIKFDNLLKKRDKDDKKIDNIVSSKIYQTLVCPYVSSIPRVFQD